MIVRTNAYKIDAAGDPSLWVKSGLVWIPKHDSGSILDMIQADIKTATHSPHVSPTKGFYLPKGIWGDLYPGKTWKGPGFHHTITPGGFLGTTSLAEGTPKSTGPNFPAKGQYRLPRIRVAAGSDRGHYALQLATAKIETEGDSKL